MLLNIIPRSIPVDEGYYTSKYPDVKEAVDRGEFKSSAQHFFEHGFFEDRIPMNVEIDREDYLERYPDVADAIRDGEVESAMEHWLAYGRHEGRTAILHAIGAPAPARPTPQKISARVRPLATGGRD